jgi:hypothetical protein
MHQGELIAYATIFLVLLLTGGYQFRSDRAIGIAIIISALLIGLKTASRLGWIQLPNVLQ